MRKKKIITLCLVLVLAALPMLNGTLAFFTDTDSTMNVMTMGSVEIVQHEQQRKLAADGSYIGLEPFQNGKKLMPSFAPDDYLTYSNLDDSYKFFSRNGENLPNAIDKIVTVENKGNIPAYVRTVFAFEAPEGFDRNAENKPGWALLTNDTEWTWTFFEGDPRFEMDDGQNYVIAVATAQNPLKAKETTIPSLLQYYLNQYTGSDDVEAFDDSLEIFAFTQAVQADGFANVKEAFEESFGDITYDSGKFSNLPWNEKPDGFPKAKVEKMEEADLNGTFENVLGFIKEADKVDGVDNVKNMVTSASQLVDFGLTFGIETKGDSKYNTWNADFVLTFNRDLPNGRKLAELNPEYAEANDKIVLVGSYEGVGAWPCPLMKDLEANKPYRVMETFGSLPGMDAFYRLSYAEVQGLVGVFDCGVMFDVPGKIGLNGATRDENLDGTTVTVELRLYETKLDENGNPVVNENGDYVETGKSYVVARKTFTYEVPDDLLNP